jgi:ParB family transcriptional regulator, chromosome partitioning protein
VRLVVAFIMAETLATGSLLVEAFGVHIKVDARQHWQPDEAFFELLRERAVGMACCDPGGFVI